MKIIRMRQVIRHHTPTRREITDEYTFLNDSTDSQNLIIVQAYSYRPSLHIYDSDGEELSLYSNDIVKEYLRSQRDSVATDLLKAIETHEKYVQWIVLPKSKPIGPNEARVIRFVYSDGKNASVLRTWSIFNISIFKIAKTVMPDSTYFSHFSVIPPEGFEIGVSRRTIEELMPDGKKVTLNESKRYHETIGDEILEFALPIRPNPVYFEVRYAVKPEKAEARLLTSFYYGLTVTSLVGFFSLLYLPADSLTQSVATAYAVFSAAIFGLSGGFISLVTNPLTHRMKYAMTIPLVISGITGVLAALKL
jgi:hypothetical protein